MKKLLLVLFVLVTMFACKSVRQEIPPFDFPVVYLDTMMIERAKMTPMLGIVFKDNNNVLQEVSIQGGYYGHYVEWVDSIYRNCQVGDTIYN